MANINLIINISNSSVGYINSTVRYARIDNTNTPVYTTVYNVTSNPLIIPDVPAGQYRIYARPNYSDGRKCPEQVIETDPCVGITSLNAVFTNPNFVIDYTYEAGLPAVKYNILFPNGGFASGIVTNPGSPISVLAPADVFGTFLITLQPVCDEDTGWFGVETAPVTVEIPEPSP